MAELDRQKTFPAFVSNFESKIEFTSKQTEILSSWQVGVLYTKPWHFGV